MSKSMSSLVYLCIAAIIGLLGLQFYWIRDYYAVTSNRFEQEVNLAFEDAIKKEFSLRNDTIQQLLTRQLLDTSAFRISSRVDEPKNRILITITNTRNRKDLTTFSNDSLNRLLPAGDTAYQRRIAEKFSLALRSEDLENHVVFYRTQNLGAFELDAVNRYNFDTARLRPVLEHYLSSRGIATPFRFYLRENDSTLNHQQFSAVLSDSFPIATKSFPTYKYRPASEQYVRALFQHPLHYVVARMGWLFAGTILLIGLVGCCIYLLLQALFREKKLAAIKNDFIDNITHEFKTPIATIAAAIEVMSDVEGLQDQQKTRRYLQHSRNELERLDALVNKILHIAIYEKGALTIHSETIAVQETIDELMNLFILSAGKTVCYTFQNSSGHNTITSDKTHFYQVVSNVVDNAIKYAGEQVAIRFSCATEASLFVITIADNGSGIPAAALPLIFDKFYRVAAKGHPVKGHGLGLHYVKTIMEHLGGSVRVESTINRGTTVYLAWPL